VKCSFPPSSIDCIVLDNEENRLLAVDFSGTLYSLSLDACKWTTVLTNLPKTTGLNNNNSNCVYVRSQKTLWYSAKLLTRKTVNFIGVNFSAPSPQLLQTPTPEYEGQLTYPSILRVDQGYNLIYFYSVATHYNMWSWDPSTNRAVHFERSMSMSSFWLDARDTESNGMVMLNTDVTGLSIVTAQRLSDRGGVFWFSPMMSGPFFNAEILYG